ncbi:helix-turn-helix domain-containing protein [Streptacidiphilus sp. PAMC 29251]
MAGRPPPVRSAVFTVVTPNCRHAEGNQSGGPGGRRQPLPCRGRSQGTPSGTHACVQTVSRISGASHRPRARGAGRQRGPCGQPAASKLAAVSGLSRAAFARAFRDALGQAPMQYLTEWRMSLARDHLRVDELTLAQIADTIGYGSPFAFAAAFRRHHAEPPGTWRQRERATAETRQLTTHPGS